jgi:hypothetical protein
MLLRCLRAIRRMPVVSMPLLSSKMLPYITTGVVEAGQTVAPAPAVVAEVVVVAIEGSANLSHR